MNTFATVLVTGDRNWTDSAVIRVALARAQSKGALVLVEGEARGADRLSAFAAVQLGLIVKRYPALWDTEGRAAGPLRNQRMLDLEQPDTVIAFHDDLSASRGTGDMVRRALKASCVVRVFAYSHVTGWRTLQ